jgi:hypothetical protein
MRAKTITGILGTVITLVVGVAPASYSQTEETTEPLRAFLRFSGSDDITTVLADERARFEAPITRDGDVSFAGSADMDVVLASCRQSIGVSVTAERECQLKAARRLSFEQLLDIRLDRSGSEWRISLDVWTDNGEKVYSAFADITAKGARDAAKQGLPTLADQYLCDVRFVTSRCFAPLGREGDDASECPVGMVANADTAGRCCWPGQGWNGKRCAGVPSSCPDGFSIDLEREKCQSAECGDGQVLMVDGSTCCWPEQALVASRCVGSPQCPHGFVQFGETCTAALECQTGTSQCGTQCVNVEGDRNNCGDCDIACKAGELCRDGRCTDVVPFIVIPNGAFTMGCDSRGSCDVDERPEHEVFVSEFEIMSTEVPEWLYLQCVNQGACSSPSGSWSPPENSSTPVTNVSWHQANGMCAWLSMRLPTEAEWEKAARGSDGRLFPSGNSEPSCNDAVTASCGGSAASVGNTAGDRSPFGVLDMGGNAREWTEDWYDADYYESSPSNDPTGASAGSKKIQRGGSYGGAAADARATNRTPVSPSSSSLTVGFRCVRDVP